MLRSRGIISSLQREILSVIASIGDNEKFYLTGGTALAEFYLGHRRSYDLDIFTVEKDIILPFSRRLEEELKGKFNVKIVRRFESFVEFEIGIFSEAIKLQLAYDSPFRFGEPEKSDIGIRVNDYKDLITDKLLALYGRAEPRDIIDFYCILKKEDFWYLTKLASQKDPGFDLYWFAVALDRLKDFPDEIEKWPVDMLIEVNIPEIKDMFSKICYQVMEEIKNRRR